MRDSVPHPFGVRSLRYASQLAAPTVSLSAISPKLLDTEQRLFLKMTADYRIIPENLTNYDRLHVEYARKFLHDAQTHHAVH